MWVDMCVDRKRIVVTPFNVFFGNVAFPGLVLHISQTEISLHASYNRFASMVRSCCCWACLAHDGATQLGRNCRVNNCTGTLTDGGGGGTGWSGRAGWTGGRTHGSTSDHQATQEHAWPAPRLPTHTLAIQNPIHIPSIEAASDQEQNIILAYRFLCHCVL